MASPYEIIKHPLSTEKSVRLMESENKLLFAVSKSSSKQQIKEAIESIFKVKVVNVNTLILPNGEKRAYIKLSKDNPAIDVATELGLV